MKLGLAAWPSGKARVCKTLIPGSIPGAASNGRLVQWLEHFVDTEEVSGSIPLAPTTALNPWGTQTVCKNSETVRHLARLLIPPAAFQPLALFFYEDTSPRRLNFR